MCHKINLSNESMIFIFCGGMNFSFWPMSLKVFHSFPLAVGSKVQIQVSLILGGRINVCGVLLFLYRRKSNDVLKNSAKIVSPIHAELIVM